MEGVARCAGAGTSASVGEMSSEGSACDAHVAGDTGLLSVDAVDVTEDSRGGEVQAWALGGETTMVIGDGNGEGVTIVGGAGGGSDGVLAMHRGRARQAGAMVRDRDGHTELRAHQRPVTFFSSDLL